nr:protein kinase superfamily protein [Tanacetum cinerariifolium]
MHRILTVKKIKRIAELIKNKNGAIQPQVQNHASLNRIIGSRYSPQYYAPRRNYSIVPRYLTSNRTPHDAQTAWKAV